MTLDLTGVIVAIIGGFFSVVTIVVGGLISSRMKDQQAAAALDAAVRNALGAIQQAGQEAILSKRPRIAVSLNEFSPAMATGVQYVLDHAGPEAARFGVSPSAIADKINAQIGLANIKCNLATAASPAPSPPPLAPVPDETRESVVHVAVKEEDHVAP